MLREDEAEDHLTQPVLADPSRGSPAHASPSGHTTNFPAGKQRAFWQIRGRIQYQENAWQPMTATSSAEFLPTLVLVRMGTGVNSCMSTPPAKGNRSRQRGSCLKPITTEIFSYRASLTAFGLLTDSSQESVPGRTITPQPPDAPIGKKLSSKFGVKWRTGVMLCGGSRLPSFPV